MCYKYLFRTVARFGAFAVDPTGQGNVCAERFRSYVENNPVLSLSGMPNVLLLLGAMNRKNKSQYVRTPTYTSRAVHGGSGQTSRIRSSRVE